MATRICPECWHEQDGDEDEVILWCQECGYQYHLDESVHDEEDE